MSGLVLKAHGLATKVARWLAIVAAVNIAVLMMVNFIDIIGTKFFSQSVPGALDISEELMVCLTLLPLAYVALERGHIRITLLEERLGPALRFCFGLMQYLLAAAITGLITVRVFVQFQKTLRLMQLKEGLDLPIWPANLVVVISFGMLTLVWILLLAKTWVKGLEE